MLRNFDPSYQPFETLLKKQVADIEAISNDRSRAVGFIEAISGMGTQIGDFEQESG